MSARQDYALPGWARWVCQQDDALAEPQWRPSEQSESGAADAGGRRCPMSFARESRRPRLIVMLQRSLEETRTPERSCVYEAECEVDGRRYSARSRHGAANELARVLVSAGVPDQPPEIRQAGIKGCITWHSLHELARWTYHESATVTLRRVRWKPPPDFSVDFRRRDAQNRGDSARAVEEDREELPGGF